MNRTKFLALATVALVACDGSTITQPAEPEIENKLPAPALVTVPANRIVTTSACPAGRCNTGTVTLRPNMAPWTGGVYGIGATVPVTVSVVGGGYSASWTVDLSTNANVPVVFPRIPWNARVTVSIRSPGFREFNQRQLPLSSERQFTAPGKPLLSNSRSWSISSPRVDFRSGTVSW